MSKPTPATLKFLAGTARKDREVADAPQFDPVTNFPDPPQFLNIDGSVLWRRLGPQLVAARVLQVVDLCALEVLCYAWQRYRAQAKSGLPITAADITAMRLMFSEFGMTPAARRRVTAEKLAASGNRFANNGRRPAEIVKK